MAATDENSRQRQLQRKWPKVYNSFRVLNILGLDVYKLRLVVKLGIKNGVLMLSNLGINLLLIS